MARDEVSFNVGWRELLDEWFVIQTRLQWINLVMPAICFDHIAFQIDICL